MDFIEISHIGGNLYWYSIIIYLGKLRDISAHGLGGVCVVYILVFLCCSIMCLYVLSSVSWCPLRFSHKNVCRGHMSCIRYLCLFGNSGVQHILWFCSSSWVPYVDVASFSWLSIFDCPFSDVYKLLLFYLQMNL
jgi:hypothetical protein